VIRVEPLYIDIGYLIAREREVINVFNSIFEEPINELVSGGNINPY
jgi:hypothetical protein